MNIDFVCDNKTKVNQFAEKGIYTVEDLLKWLPRKYYDFRNPVLLSKAPEDDVCAVIILVRSVISMLMKNGRPMTIIKGVDDSNTEVDIFYFNVSYVAEQINRFDKVLFCGKVEKEIVNGRVKYKMTNPQRFSKNIKDASRIVPVYKSIKGMSGEYFQKIVNQALAIVDKEDYLEPSIVNKFNLMRHSEALLEIHQPETMEGIEKAKNRYLFDDLFYFNLNLYHQESLKKKEVELLLNKYDTVKKYIADLPYELTEGQKETIHNMWVKAKQMKRVNALVQGDVGTGKTEVAKIMMLTAYDSGYQSVLMAPTNVLAKQHYKDFVRCFEKYGVKIAFLSTEVKAREKKQILKDIANGNVDMVIGTHSVISKDVIYKNLALAVIDEEHKFGVKQREALQEKASEIHSISLSATPIPRSLALSLFGDSIDVCTIKTMPKNRKPVKTTIAASTKEAYQAIEKLLSIGQQAYIVCPLITDSEKRDDLISVEQATEEARKYFGKKGYKVDSINGSMKQDLVNAKIQEFVEHKFDILVSTTIIEVGVNIPNANLIFIRSASQFGLAQLHQLRGRVGRSDKQGYCVLEGNVDEEVERLQVMVDTNDGFEVAKRDLEMRGTGDFIGTTQSGDNKYIMLMIQYPELNKKIKNEIIEIFENPERFEKYKYLIEEIEE